jgi:anion-transporting  ArsA/GET3 family ATPase
MSSQLKLKRFDLFFGTGGVGKTTLAAARAIDLAEQGYNVLLMTIDPAKRLKDILGLSDEGSGELSVVTELPEYGVLKTPLNALLMNPQKTIERMGKKAKVEELQKNRIVEVLTRPYGGMNEILALIELKMRIDENKYDCVVLDTPPGSHFLDFLDGVEKIRQFFDHRFVEIFTSLGKKALSSTQKNFFSGIVDKVVEMGVNKLLDYLQKVTGTNFVDDFLVALEVIYRSRSSFMQGLEMEEMLASENNANWFLVTSVEQGKISEALDIQQNAEQKHKRSMYLVLNKTLSTHIGDWNPSSSSAVDLKKYLLNKENIIKNSKSFNSSFDFPEVLAKSPIEHIKVLAKTWRSHAHLD